MNGQAPRESDDDADLIRRSRAGDAGAFERVVWRYEGRLLRYLRQRTARRHDAEDLLQEVFVKAWQSLARIDPARPLAPWLFAVARNAAISHGRQVRRRRMAELPDLADGRTPGPTLDQQEQSARIWDLARSALAERSFSALWLMYAEDMNVHEIAGALGVSSGHAKVLLHRARRRLAQVFAQSSGQWHEAAPAPAPAVASGEV